MCRWIVVLALFTGCFGGDFEPAKPAVQPPVAPKPPPEPKTPSFDEALAAARRHALAGNHAEAMASAEKLLAQKPESDEVWRLVEQEALAAGKARELLDRLDASQAIGGRVGPHQLLRATLALAAKDASTALTAARAAESADPDGAAALVAQAVAAGAPAPRPREAIEGATASRPDPAAELIALVTASNWRAAEPHLEGARKVGGWRAALVRGRVEEALGAFEEAHVDYAAAATDPDPRGQVRGKMARARLVLAGHTAPAEAGAHEDPVASAAKWAAEALAIAEGNANVADTVEALHLLVAAEERQVRPDDAVEAARGVHDLLSKAGNEAASAEVALVLARVGLEAGLPIDAAEAAAEARNGLDGDSKALAAWYEGLANTLLGRADAVAQAAQDAGEARSEVLGAFVRALQGEPGACSGKLPFEKLADTDRVWADLEAARLDLASAEARLKDAIEAADRLGRLPERITSRLALDAVLRREGRTDARLRSALLALAPQGAAGEPLRTELAVRGWIDGEKAPAFATAGMPEVVRAWADLAAGRAALDSAAGTGGDSWGALLRAWARGRAAIAAKDPEAWRDFAAAVAHLPTHRQGPLDTGTALDGSQGLPWRSDLASFEAVVQPDSGVLGAGLALHAGLARARSAREELLAGLDPLAGVPTEAREGLLAAVARVRAGMAAWFAGGQEFPSDAIQALAGAEAKAAGGDGAFVSLAPGPAPTLDAVRGLLGRGSALISYVVVGGHLHSLVVTKAGGHLRELGPFSRVEALAERQVSMLRRAGTEGHADPSIGNQLRQLILDPLSDDLVGIGRYLVVAPEALLTFPLTTFPEEASAIRYLADIRMVAQVPELRQVMGRSAPSTDFDPSFLALAVPKERGVREVQPALVPAGGNGATDGKGAEENAASADGPAGAGGAKGAEALASEGGAPRVVLPPDVRAAKRLFEEQFSKVLAGSDATVAAWDQFAPHARYLHLSGIDAAPGGGFRLADGVLDLNHLRRTKLAADLVVVTATAPPAVQVARARALLVAGARSVVVLAWPIPETAVESYIGEFYSSLNREHRPLDALSQARQAGMSDALLGRTEDDPAHWGAWIDFGWP